MKKTLVVLTLILAAWTATYAAEPRPRRIVLTENDKFTFDKSRFSVGTFIIKDIEIKFKEAGSFFDAVGGEAKNYYMKALHLYKKHGYWWRYSYERVELTFSYAKGAVMTLNDFLKVSQANRDKIAKILQDREDEIWRKKEEERLKKLREEEENYERLKDKKMAFFSLFFGGAFGTNGGENTLLENTYGKDYSRGAGNMNLGLKFIYYFKKPFDKINYGLAAQISINSLFFSTHFVDKTDYDGNITYYELDLLFVAKIYMISYKHNCHFGIGPAFSVKGSKTKSYSISYLIGPENHVYNFKDFLFGGIIELGYHYISKSLKFSLLFNMYVKVETPHFTQYINGVKVKNKASVFVGFRLGFGFNLL